MGEQPSIDAASRNIVAPASQASIPEPTAKKEVGVTKERQSKEIFHEAKTTINRALKDAAKDDKEPTDAGGEALKNVNKATNLEVNQTWTHTATDTPMMVKSSDGKDNPIKSVHRVSQNTFECMVIGPDGKLGPITLTYQDLIDHAVVAEATSLPQAFSGEERQLVELYFQIVKSGEAALVDVDETKTNELIKKVAQKGGQLTVKDVKSLHDKTIADEPTPPDADDAKKAEIKQANDKKATLRELFQKVLEGRNILTAEDASLLIQAGGISRETLQEFGVKPERFGEYFVQVENGRISQETALQIANHIRAGNIEQVIPLLPQIQEETDQDERDKKTATLKKVLQTVGPYVGIGGFLMIFLMLKSKDQ